MKRNGFLVLILLGLVLATAVVAAASAGLATGAPSVVSYQGYLTSDGGQPLNGLVDLRAGIYAGADGGPALWQEFHDNVPVANGYFAIELGSVEALGASVFKDPDRYLQVEVDSGGGYVTMPRQRFTSVPYALQAQAAAVAGSVPWDGLADVPPGFADKVDDEGGEYQNVIVVAKAGGDYTSVAAGLASITAPAAGNRYLVWVAPGVYTETGVAHIPAYVHLRGAGPAVSVVTSSRSAAAAGIEAATVAIDDLGQVSDLRIVNDGASDDWAIGIWSASATPETVVDNVRVLVTGSGGTEHYGIYLYDSEPTIRDSYVKTWGASGYGTATNAAVGATNVAGGMPRATIVNSVLIGGQNNTDFACVDNTGTGYGLKLTEASAIVDGSKICGGRRGIAVLTNGLPQVTNSVVNTSTSLGSYLFEVDTAGVIKIASTGVSYLGNKYTGTSTGLTCVHAYDYGTYAALTDATGDSGNACD